MVPLLSLFLSWPSIQSLILSLLLLLSLVTAHPAFQSLIPSWLPLYTLNPLWPPLQSPQPAIMAATPESPVIMVATPESSAIMATMPESSGNMISTPEPPPITDTMPESQAIIGAMPEYSAITDTTSVFPVVIKVAHESIRTTPRHLRLALSLEDTPLMLCRQLASLWCYQVWGSQRWSHCQLYSLLQRWPFCFSGPHTALQSMRLLQSLFQFMNPPQIPSQSMNPLQSTFQSKPAPAPELSPLLAPACEFPACPVSTTEVIPEHPNRPVLTTVVPEFSACPVKGAILELSACSVTAIEAVTNLPVLSLTVPPVLPWCASVQPWWSPAPLWCSPSPPDCRGRLLPCLLCCGLLLHLGGPQSHQLLLWWPSDLPKWSSALSASPW